MPPPSQTSLSTTRFKTPVVWHEYRRHDDNYMSSHPFSIDINHPVIDLSLAMIEAGATRLMT